VTVLKEIEHKKNGGVSKVNKTDLTEEEKE